MAGDVTQLSDIWSQSLTRGAAERRGFNYANEHSIRRSQRWPGAAVHGARTHTHTLAYHLHSPDTPAREVDWTPTLWALLYSSLTQLFFFICCLAPLLPHDCPENVRSMREITPDKCEEGVVSSDKERGRERRKEIRRGVDCDIGMRGRKGKTGRREEKERGGSKRKGKKGAGGKRT